jgi:Ca2+/Na+ antiporter
MCVLILLYMCPHTYYTVHSIACENTNYLQTAVKVQAGRVHPAIYVPAYYYICVLILIYNYRQGCQVAFKNTNAGAPKERFVKKKKLSPPAYCTLVSSYYYMRVSILLYMSPHRAIYVSS